MEQPRGWIPPGTEVRLPDDPNRTGVVLEVGNAYAVQIGEQTRQYEVDALHRANPGKVDPDTFNATAHYFPEEPPPSPRWSRD